MLSSRFQAAHTRSVIRGDNVSSSIVGGECNRQDQKLLSETTCELSSERNVDKHYIYFLMCSAIVSVVQAKSITAHTHGI